MVGLGCLSIEVRGGGVEAGSLKSLKQALAAALPCCWTLIGCSSGSTAGLQETVISRPPSGSTSWVLSSIRGRGGA